jgi:hypothetical protein
MALLPLTSSHCSKKTHSFFGTTRASTSDMNSIAIGIISATLVLKNLHLNPDETF